MTKNAIESENKAREHAHVLLDPEFLRDQVIARLDKVYRGPENITGLSISNEQEIGQCHFPVIIRFYW